MGRREQAITEKAAAVRQSVDVVKDSGARWRRSCFLISRLLIG